jgi:phosphocarrier protein HPr
MIEKQFNILSRTGFARPASMLVSISNKYLSKLVFEFEGTSVELNYSPDSIMDVMSLEIRPGDEFNIRAEGIDEDEAVQRIEECLREMTLIT